MRDFRKMYESKRGSVQEALAIIKNGDSIVPGYCATEPFTILSQLHTLKDKNGIDHLHMLYTLANGDYEFFKEEYRDFIEIESFFFGAANRRLYQTGACSFVPGNLHEGVKRRDPYKKPNVFIVAVTAMDRHGYFRTSLSNMYDRHYFDEADRIIVEVNPNLPVVNGDTEVHITQVDRVVEVDTPIPKIPLSVLTEEDKSIGEYVASLVADGDTIQLGIGGIPDAVAMALMGKKELGIHTEMINSGMARLLEAGVVTNRKKTLHRGKTVGAFAYGDQMLYDHLHENPAVLMLPAEYVNHPAVVAKNDNMVAINTAMQVDLTGQVSSEGIGTRHYSGTGGQTDMSLGATHAKNGRSIIALHSTAKGGTISTINACLPLGSGVSLSRNSVDYIVTEYGIAPMKGRSIKERVQNLISIAHPDYRKQLKQDAEKLMLW